MKEKITNNLGLKIVSICAAFFIWLLVINVSNPIVQKTQEVPVEMLNAGILEASDLTYEIIGKSTATVSYEVRALDAYKISASDFHVYADLAELYDATGAIELKVDVVGKKYLLQGNPVAKPSVIRVETEALQMKKFPLSVNTNGAIEEGYAQGTVTVSPDYVYVRGSETLIGQINSVGIEVDVDGADADISGKATPILYDSNNNKLDFGDKVTVNHPEIQYSIQILKVKNLNLNFEVSGTVANGYKFTGVESSQKTIAVQGLKSVLGSIGNINIPGTELDVTGATKNIDVTVDISKYLPENVKIVGKSNIVTVTLKVEPLVTKDLMLLSSEISQSGAKDGFAYIFEPKAIKVTVKGLADDLKALNGQSLKALIKLSGMHEGVNTGVLSFDAGDAYEIVSYEDFTVKMQATQTQAQVSTETISPAETVSASVEESTEAEQ